MMRSAASCGSAPLRRGDAMVQRRGLVVGQRRSALVERCASRRTERVIRGRLDQRMRERDGAIRGRSALLEQMRGHGQFERREGH